MSQSGVEMGRAATRLLVKMINENLDRQEVSDVVLSLVTGQAPPSVR